MWFRRWFDQLHQIKVLEERLSVTEASLKDSKWRCEQLEKQVEKERTRTNKYVIDLSNVCGRMLTGKQANLFTEVKEPVENVVAAPERHFEPYELEKFEYFAKQMRDRDVQQFGDAPPLENYIAKIKEDPEYSLMAVM